MKVATCVLLAVLGAAEVHAAPMPETNNAGQARSWTIIRDYLAKERKSGTPILVAECLSTDTSAKEYSKEVVIFDVGQKTGRFFVFSWFMREKPEAAVLGDYADIKFGPPKSPRVIIENVSQGGFFEYQTFQLDVEYLLHSGLKLLYPKDFGSLISTVPAACPPPWDFDSSSLKSDIDKIYKDRHW